MEPGSACSDFGLDGDTGLLLGNPRRFAGEDDQVVVFDEDLAVKVDAGSPDAAEPLDEPG